MFLKAMKTRLSLKTMVTDQAQETAADRAFHDRKKKMDDCYCCSIIKCSQEVSNIDENNTLWFITLPTVSCHSIL